MTLLADYFNNDQYETMLAAGRESDSEGSMESYVLDHGIKPVLIPSLQRELSLIRDIKTLIALYRLLKRYKPDIVHTHTSKAGFIGRLAARLAGAPVIIHTYHGHVFKHYFGTFKTRIFIYIEKILAIITDRIVAISESQAEDLKLLGIGRNKISIIPLGFNFCRVNKGNYKSLLKKRYCINDNSRLIGTVGRLTPIKNHSLFLKTAAKLLQHRNDLYFFIVGDGELRRSLEIEAEQLKIEDKVVFTGWIEDMASVYNELDLLMLTSLNEGTPLTVIEAMVAGCAVVSTDVGGVSDIIEHGENGLLSPSGDYNAMAEQVLWFFESPEAGKLMVEKAKSKALAKYSAERLHNDLEHLYEEILKKKQVIKA